VFSFYNTQAQHTLELKANVLGIFESAVELSGGFTSGGSSIYLLTPTLLPDPCRLDWGHHSLENLNKALNKLPDIRAFFEANNSVKARELSDWLLNSGIQDLALRFSANAESALKMWKQVDDLGMDLAARTRLFNWLLDPANVKDLKKFTDLFAKQPDLLKFWNQFKDVPNFNLEAILSKFPTGNNGFYKKFFETFKNTDETISADALKFLEDVRDTGDDFIGAFKSNAGLFDAWKALYPRATRTDIKHLNFFSDPRMITSRSNLLNHPTIDFEQLFPYLSQEELTAIHHYTTRAYIDLNAALRSSNPLSAYHSAFVDILNEALNKMPKYQGPFFRGTSIPEAVLQDYLNALPPGSGKFVFDKAFSSSSNIDIHIGTFQNLRKKDGEVKIIITGTSSTGVYIDDLSYYGKNFQTDPLEIQHEVLFKPNTKFEHFEEPEIYQNSTGETIYHFFMNEKLD